MAKRKLQSDHDKMVKQVADVLVDKNFKDVKADIPEFTTPTKIIWEKTEQGHIPDATGKGDKLVIIEVETDDSINDQHTEDQWSLFSAYASQHNAEFIVGIPTGSKKKAEKRLTELNLIGEVLEI